MKKEIRIIALLCVAAIACSLLFCACEERGLKPWDISYYKYIGRRPDDDEAEEIRKDFFEFFKETEAEAYEKFSAGKDTAQEETDKYIEDRIEICYYGTKNGYKVLEIRNLALKQNIFTHSELVINSVYLGDFMDASELYVYDGEESDVGEKFTEIGEAVKEGKIDEMHLSEIEECVRYNIGQWVFSRLDKSYQSFTPITAETFGGVTDDRIYVYLNRNVSDYDGLSNERLAELFYCIDYEMVEDESSRSERDDEQYKKERFEQYLKITLKRRSVQNTFEAVKRLELLDYVRYAGPLVGTAGPA